MQCVKRQLCLDIFFLTIASCGYGYAIVCNMRIVTDPQDVAVSVGGTAQFSCSYIGTAVPSWSVIVNDEIPAEILPYQPKFWPRHSISHHNKTIVSGCMYSVTCPSPPL